MISKASFSTIFFDRKYRVSATLHPMWDGDIPGEGYYVDLIHPVLGCFRFKLVDDLDEGGIGWIGIETEKKIHYEILEGLDRAIQEENNKDMSFFSSSPFAPN